MYLRGVNQTIMAEDKQKHSGDSGRSAQEKGRSAGRRALRNWVLSLLGIAFVGYVAWDVFLSDDVVPVNLGEADQYAVQPPDATVKKKDANDFRYSDDAPEQKEKAPAAKEEEATAEPAELEGGDLMQGGGSITPESVTENPAPVPAKPAKSTDESAAPPTESAPKASKQQPPAEGERLFD